MDARTTVAKDLAAISRQDNAAMWSGPNPDSPGVPFSKYLPLSLSLSFPSFVPRKHNFVLQILSVSLQEKDDATSYS